MMRKVLVGAVPALLLIGGPAEAATPTWKISEVSGPVTLMEGGRTRAARRGALLASGAMIATSGGGRAVIVRGQEFVVISPGSRLRVPDAKSGNRIVQLIQDLGSAMFRIEKKSTPHFGVQTPYLAAVVKGTTFTVTVGPESSKVEVSEGAVEVATLDGGAADMVRPGMMAMVGKNDRFQLVIQGDQTRILRSPNAPTASVTVPAPVQPAAAPAVVQIFAAVTEEPVSLGEATDGLLEGAPAAELAMADLQDLARAPASGDPQPQPAPPEPTPPAPPPADPTPPPPAQDGGDDDGKDKDDDKGPDKEDDKGPGKDDDKGPDKHDDKGPGKDEGKGSDKDDDKGPGKDDDKGPGKDDDKGPDKDDDKGPGKDDDKGPGEDDDKGPGKDDDKGPDKDDDKGPGKDDDKGPGKDDDKGPGKEDDKGPGKDDDKGPGKDDDKGPGKDDDKGPGKEDDEGPGKDEGKGPDKNDKGDASDPSKADLVSPAEPLPLDPAEDPVLTPPTQPPVDEEEDSAAPSGSEQIEIDIVD
jgi:hypothetical protein